MKEESRIWYAFLEDREDNDWGVGTFDEAEAMKWLAETENGEALIAVIDDGDDPVCIDEIAKADL